jgi:aspartate aminotransferase
MMAFTSGSRFNRRVAALSAAATSGLSERITTLKAKGLDLISLATGEADFDTPEHIRQAAVAAIARGETRYTPTAGTLALKQAIINKFAQENDLTFTANEVVVGNGAKQVLYNFLQTLVDDGDEVIFAAPYWVSYPEMVKAAGGHSVVITTTLDTGFKLTPAQLAQAISEKTKVFIFCSPNNPSGHAYSKTEMAAIAEVLRKFPDIWVITDDIYEHLMWSEQAFCHLLNVCPALATRTLLVNGVSKTFAMTGWRIGYGAGPAEVIEMVVRLQSHSTSGACSIAQAAAVAALTGPKDQVRLMCQEFKKRHDYLYQQLQQLPLIKCRPSDGTFYLFVDVRQWIATLPEIDTDIAFAEYLIDQVGVAVVPGSAFGTPGHIRFSFAVSTETLKIVIERLKRLLV